MMHPWFVRTSMYSHIRVYFYFSSSYIYIFLLPYPQFLNEYN